MADNQTQSMATPQPAPPPAVIVAKAPPPAPPSAAVKPPAPPAAAAKPAAPAPAPAAPQAQTAPVAAPQPAAAEAPKAAEAQAQAPAPKMETTEPQKNDVAAILAKNAECMKARHDSIMQSLGKISDAEQKTLISAIEAQVARVKEGETSGIGLFEKDGVTEKTVTRFLGVATKTKAEIERLFEVARKVTNEKGDLSKLDEQTFDAVRAFHGKAFEALAAMDVYLGIPVTTPPSDLSTAAKVLNEAGRLSDEAVDYYDQEERRRLELNV